MKALILAISLVLAGCGGNCDSDCGEALTNFWVVVSVVVILSLAGFWRKPK